jgi:hypothetical protein
MKAMSFNNVVMHVGVEKYINMHHIPREQVHAHPMLEPVIAKLAVLYPLWRFVASGHTSTHGNVWLTDFAVSCDGEPLGTISRDYVRRDYHIVVANERIKAAMDRGSEYKTTSPDKAVAKVKKMFSPKSTQELAESVREQITKIARDAEWSKEREMNAAHEIVARAAKKYVMGDGFETFMNHAKEYYPAQEYDLLLENKEIAVKAKEECVTIAATAKVISGKRSGAIVTRRGGMYVVQQGDKLEICDDNTLPEWVRNQIGLLKLIEPKQFVSNSGMRATEDVFVLIKPEEENLTTVSEGGTK